MKIIDIKKETNEAIVNYNVKDTTNVEIIGFYYYKGKLVCQIKFPSWICNGNIKNIIIDNDYELIKKE